MIRWCDKVIHAVEAGGPGGYAVAFPAYRPDLVSALAAALDCAHVDFRKEVLSPHGFAAHTLPLSEIERCAQERAAGRGIVLANAEALLAAKPEDDRRAFLAAFLASPRKDIVLLPLALYGALAAGNPRLVTLDEAALPPETLLSQLASMRIG